MLSSTLLTLVLSALTAAFPATDIAAKKSNSTGPYVLFVASGVYTNYTIYPYTSPGASAPGRLILSTPIPGPSLVAHIGGNTGNYGYKHLKLGFPKDQYGTYPQYFANVPLLPLGSAGYGVSDPISLSNSSTNDWQKPNTTDIITPNIQEADQALFGCIEKIVVNKTTREYIFLSLGAYNGTTPPAACAPVSLSALRY